MHNYILALISYNFVLLEYSHQVNEATVKDNIWRTLAQRETIG